MSAPARAAEEPDLVSVREGGLGVVRLNRPRALNALTLPMVRAFEAALDRFEADPGVRVILLEGAGERGLCAGGDIRALYDSGRAGDDGGARFLREEYALDARIARLGKPYVALMDGLVMGGGVGISAHGRHRVVTERSRVAMPEVAIGFFPDVGATWLLPRAPGEVGTYLALTGEAVGAADALHAGLADLAVPSHNLPELCAALARLGPGESVAAVIRAHAFEPEPGPVARHQALVDRAFGHESVEAIVTALETDGSDFAQASLTAMRAHSPTSLKLALRLLRLGRDARSLEACLVQEFDAARGVLAGHDLYEGIRAAVVDKDRRPRWQPATLAEVSEADLAPYLLRRADAPLQLAEALR